MKINPYKYPFIAVEGIDGCGKSTLIAGLIQKWSMENKIGAVFTKEPTDDEIGRKIRKILHNGGCDSERKKVAAADLQRLYIEDRRNHRKAEALVLQHYPIITDRDFVSTFAYGTAGGVDAQWIFSAHEIMLDEYFFVSDLVLILDLSPEEAIERFKKKGKETDYFEKLEFLKEVRKTYLDFSQTVDEFYPNVELSCVVISASQPPEKVLEDSLFWISKCFQKKLETR